MPAPEQSWVEVTREIVARFELCAKMNLQHVNTPQGCAAMAHVIKKMATIIDNEIDRRNRKP
jgi:hypothetical protein